MPKRFRKLKSLLRNERGNVVVFAAVALPLLIGCSGLAIDTIQWVRTKSQLQHAADTAAKAGVYALLQGGDPQEAVARSVTAGSNLDGHPTIDVRWPVPERQDDPYAVAVRITAPAPLSFASMFLKSPITLDVAATATVVDNGEFCAFALGGGDAQGVFVEAGSNIELECGIATNSSSAQAFVADPSAIIKAASIVSHGGISAAEARNGHGRARSHGLRQKDPLANTEPPEVPNSGCPNVTVNPVASYDDRASVTLEPGCYGNMVLNGQVTLASGEYILNRGNLIVGPHGRITCTSCSIFLTSRDAAADPGSIGKVRVHENATLNLKAPTSGANAGVLIYQDRRAAATSEGLENIVAGNGSSTLEGLIYFPSEPLRVNGKLSPDFSCARFIGRRLVVGGHIAIVKDCDGGLPTLMGSEVQLIG